jgi:uncharacterized protein YlaI
MTRAVLCCPECDAAVNHDGNHRLWCDGGRRAEPDERWICRGCEHTFAEPETRLSKRAGVGR